MTHHTHNTPKDLKEDVPEDVVAAGAVANVTQYLDGVEWPATREDVERKARANGADESALQEIKALPADKRFENPADLIKAVGNEVHGL